MPFVRAALIAAIIAVTSPVAFAGPRQPLAPARLDAMQSKAIDAFVASEMERQQIPGVAVGIFSHGAVLLAKGYGFANVEHGVPVKPETIFQSGSVGKQFVAAAIMLLDEEGRVALDDPISKVFPESPPQWRSIRVEHLLSHTSGLAEYETPERTGPRGPFYLRLDFTEDELVERIAALPIEAAPASNWDYRNTNYVLLGILIHRVTGMRLWTVFPMADGKPNPAGYGFGWMIGQQNDKARIEHSGAWQGFTSDISRYPNDGLTVVVLANLDAAHARAGYMAHVVAGLVAPPLLPPRLVTIGDEDAIAAMRVREALDRLANGQDLSSRFTPPHGGRCRGSRPRRPAKGAGDGLARSGHDAGREEACRERHAIVAVSTGSW